MRYLQALKALILNTLFPPVCVSCKKEGEFLCVDCLRNLSKKKISSGYHKYEDPDLHHLDGVIYALDYAKNPQIQAAIKQLKYRFTEDLAKYFGKLIAEKMSELHMTKDRQLILVPVPLHKKRLNYRGFNQAEVIARAVTDSSESEISVIEILKRVKHTSQQAKLNKDERHENLKNAFQFVPSAWPARTYRCGTSGGSYLIGGEYTCPERSRMDKGQERKINKRKKHPIIFLVDDVFTTGATLENCAQVLKENGIEKVYGVVIARAFK